MFMYLCVGPYGNARILEARSHSVEDSHRKVCGPVVEIGVTQLVEALSCNWFPYPMR